MVQEASLTRRRVLISGAGIAGCTLAYWLARRGMRVTVVERSVAQRSSGAPVDVRGPAADVADRMGITRALRVAQTDVSAMRFVTAQGAPAGRVELDALRRSEGDARDIELPRGALAGILADASRSDAEFIYDDHVQLLAQDACGVDVELARGGRHRFDLVIGADGLHSGIRRLTFGPEREFVRHAGLYVATVALSHDFDVGGDIVMCNAPGRSVTIHPGRRKPIAAFIFWHDTIRDFDHRDRQQHEQILARVYAGDGWHVPALLEETRSAVGDLYFDAVSRVDVPRWSVGRVVLVGDAASCVSLFGDGSTLAIAGAHTLAEALGEHGDFETALQEYEARHRALVMPRQQSMALGASVLVPRTRLGLGARNLALRLLPLAAPIWARRRRTPRA
jgi:2-polyprenyl-6-methoxyphenol hydroxylase-like FAD-dependent oxidoreductase